MLESITPLVDSQEYSFKRIHHDTSDEWTRGFGNNIKLQTGFDIVRRNDGKSFPLIRSISIINFVAQFELQCIGLFFQPGMSGIQVLQEIRKNLSKDIPVLMVSAATQENFKDEAIEAGANDFLCKPFRRVDHSILVLIFQADLLNRVYQLVQMPPK
jgi:CheY-like chemotaxis protein